MEKLEHYLDQVCRGIGGPKSLRQHVRQELREHLLDAVAEHKAAGLSDEEALGRALADFGGAEQVRSELEATHGHRLMAVVIDKAMQWKENTMKAKWLWTSWAHIALAGVIALEVLWITFASLFLVPKFQRLLLDGIINPVSLDEHGMYWMVGFLNGLRHVGDRYTTWLLLLAALAVGLFEWRVRSENKTFIRLSAWGTAAVGLMVVAVLTAASLVIPFELGIPALGRMGRTWYAKQAATMELNSWIAALDEASAKKDWEAMQEPAERATRAMKRLSDGPLVTYLTRQGEPPTVEELRAQLKSATESLQQAQQAIRDKDADRLKMALQKFHELYAPVAKAAARPES